MGEKQKRQQKILAVISSRMIGRQEDLGQALKEVGIETTQSTLSKDIKELGILKAPNGAGGFKYQNPSFGDAGSRMMLTGEPLLRREIRDFAQVVDGAGHTAVIKTRTGHAQGVCEAIDQVLWPEVVGTLAGENTIFVLCRSEVDCRRLRDRIEEMLP
ncbi:MAG: arginine repressor [bacterium]|jgi:transcriptional regulator of arginine metabolism|nr:arginine repressor [bacterium]